MRIRRIFLKFLVALFVAVVSGGKDNGLSSSRAVQNAAKTFARQTNAAVGQNKQTQDSRKNRGQLIKSHNLGQLQKKSGRTEKPKSKNDKNTENQARKVKMLKKKRLMKAKKLAKKALAGVNILPGLATDMRPQVAHQISNVILTQLSHILGENTTVRHSAYNNIYGNGDDDGFGRKNDLTYDSYDNYDLYEDRHHGSKKSKVQKNTEKVSDEDDRIKKLLSSEEGGSEEGSAELENRDSHENSEEKDKLDKSIEISTVANGTIESPKYAIRSTNKTNHNLHVSLKNLTRT